MTDVHEFMVTWSCAPVPFRRFTGFNLLWESQSGEAKKRASCRNPNVELGLVCTTSPRPRKISSIVIFIMFCRTLRTSRAARTIRCNNLVPKSRRLVTTDAASSHAEKDDVPAVSQWAGIGHLPYLELTLPSRYRKMTSPSMSDFQMRVSKPMSLILPHIPSKRLRRSSRRCTMIWSR